MKLILLTKGFVARVDDIDYPKVSQFKWHALTSKTGPVYAARKVWRRGKRTALLMHRAILGVPEGVKVDHRNGNGCDNRRCNLRRATDQQNQRAFKSSRVGKTSKYRGVCFHKKTGKWQAQISLGNSHNTYLGLFSCPIKAAKVRDAAALEHFGEFAALNFKHK